MKARVGVRLNVCVLWVGEYLGFAGDCVSVWREMKKEPVVQGRRYICTGCSPLDHYDPDERSEAQVINP